MSRFPAVVSRRGMFGYRRRVLQNFEREPAWPAPR
jgi:hypothetical protein